MVRFVIGLSEASTDKTESTSTSESVNSSTSADHGTFTNGDLSPQQSSEKSCGCGETEGMKGPEAGPVYAIGMVKCIPRNSSVDNEYLQATKKHFEPANPEATRSALSLPENRYLAREMCWILEIQNVETYVLIPSDLDDLKQLIQALGADLDIVIGTRGPLSRAEMCSGRTLPIVYFDLIYSSSKEELLRKIPRPDNISAKTFGPTSEKVYNAIIQMTDNVGATDRDRAVNLSVVRDLEIYGYTAENDAKDFFFKGIEVHPSLTGKGQGESRCCIHLSPSK